MRELFNLVMETASEGDFGEIQRTIGEPEMEVDVETKQIDESEYVAAFIDDDGEVQIPVVTFRRCTGRCQCYLASRTYGVWG